MGTQVHWLSRRLNPFILSCFLTVPTFQWAVILSLYESSTKIPCIYGCPGGQVTRSSKSPLLVEHSDRETSNSNIRRPGAYFQSLKTVLSGIESQCELPRHRKSCTGWDIRITRLSVPVPWISNGRARSSRCGSVSKQLPYTATRRSYGLNLIINDSIVVTIYIRLCSILIQAASLNLVRKFWISKMSRNLILTQVLGIGLGVVGLSWMCHWRTPEALSPLGMVLVGHLLFIFHCNLSDREGRRLLKITLSARPLDPFYCWTQLLKLFITQVC